MELVRSRLLSEGSIWHIGSLSAIYLSQGLSGGTLFALTTYLVSIGSSVTDISLLLSITMIPWTLKVFIGPIIDSFTISRFGRRRFWVLISQLMMILALLPLVFIEVLEVNWVMISLLTLHNTFVAISDIARSFFKFKTKKTNIFFFHINYSLNYHLNLFFITLINLFYD